MKKHVKLSFLFVILSFFIHLYLARQHYELKYGFENSSSLCTLSDTFNCEAVTLSSYSYFLNLPMALWGSVFHLVFFVLLSLQALNPAKLVYSRLNFIFTALSAVASTIMLTISLTLMSTYCLFCMGLYVLSYLNLGNYILYSDKPLFPNMEDLKEKVIYISLIAIPVLAFLFHDMSTKSYGGKISSFLNEHLIQWQNSPSVEFDQPLLSMGNPNSSFKVVEFADFQCIHCKNSAPKLHAFFLSNPNAHFSFYAFPLDGRCNPGATVRDGRSCLMAQAVYCAEKESKGWAAHKWIFDEFGSPDNTNFKKLQSDLKLSEGFESCMNSEEAIRAIENQSLAGQKAKIDGTPAVFVNGKRLPAGHYLPVLEALHKQLKSNQLK